MITGEVGRLLIVLAAATNIIVLFAFSRAARGDQSYLLLAHRAYHVFVGLVIAAAGLLYYLFFSHDFSFQYVYEYSDRSLPFFYLVSSFWGGQEGTYLLWLLLNGLFGYIILRRAGQYKCWAMVIYSTINMFFLSILMKLSPFALMSYEAVDGAGLNPLLQDPWMVIHPPVVFVGYAMSSVPFAIGMAALILNDYSGWLKRVFPWVAVTALTLAAGNILGGYWAYKTLGWGGYWGWDPVENSSFIPWFVSLAAVHGLVIEKRSGAFRRINLLLTAFVFQLVIYGTFLTRSGVLADFSVHSFVDLGINNYLIGFMLFFLALTLVLFLLRAKRIESAVLSYNFYGKEFMLFAGMLLLFLFSMVVLVWTSLPLITSAFSENPSAANPVTYNSFAIPFAIIYALMLSVSPFATFHGFSPRNWRVKLAILIAGGMSIGFGLLYWLLGQSAQTGLLVAVIVVVAGMFWLKSDVRWRLVPGFSAFVLVAGFAISMGQRDYLFTLFFATATMAAVANLASLSGFLPHRWKLMGGELAHFGFGLMLLGILGSSAFDDSTKLVLPRGVENDAYGLTISYMGMEHDIGYQKNELVLSVYDGFSTHEARPQWYYSERQDGYMKKPHIERSMMYDLYFAPEQVQQLKNSREVRFDKGQTKEVEGYTLTFVGYDVNQSHDVGEMGVTARFELDHAGSTSDLSPAVMIKTDAEGQTRSDLTPAKFGDSSQYALSVKHISADDGTVVVSIAGLKDAGPPDQLILDITKKPGINLVWIGTTLIMLGSAILFVRRREEMRI